MSLFGIGARIRETREKKALLSIPDFAQSLDVHRSTIIRWEREESYPDARLIEKLTNIYGINPTWLLTGKQHLTIQWDTLNHIAVEGLGVCEDLGITTKEQQAEIIVELYKWSEEIFKVSAGNHYSTNSKEKTLSAARIVATLLTKNRGDNNG